MQPRVPEKDKKAGVCYAVTDDGLELPVIDVTHPAFGLDLSQAQIDELQSKHLQELKSRERVPAFLQRPILGIMQSQSFLMRGIADSEGGFLSGMNTYIMKLGADNLNRGFARSLDRSVAASFPVLSIRLRLQDVSELLAESLRAPLRKQAKAPLCLLNIGGGPAIDSLNALILLQKQHPELLAGRPISVNSLDLEEGGASFGSRALASLRAGGGPLHNLDIAFNYVRYDWSDATALRDQLDSVQARNAVFAASSEGALFEYGSDEEIVANLQALHESTSAQAIVAGTVTRADEIGRIMNGSSRAALKLRGLEAFRALGRQAGWTIGKAVDRPMSHDVLMEKI